MEKPPAYKIFLVDDDHFLLNMYSVKFTGNGLTVSTASSGADALKQLNGGLSPDIIMFDVVMPGMDGLEFLSELRKQKLAPNAVVIALTNQGQSSDIERAKKLGVNGYIVKASTIPSEVFDEVMKIAKANGK